MPRPTLGEVLPAVYHLSSQARSGVDLSQISRYVSQNYRYDSDTAVKTVLQLAVTRGYLSVKGDKFYPTSKDFKLSSASLLQGRRRRRSRRRRGRGHDLDLADLVLEARRRRSRRRRGRRHDMITDLVLEARRRRSRRRRGRRYDEGDDLLQARRRRRRRGRRYDVEIDDLLQARRRRRRRRGRRHELDLLLEARRRRRRGHGRRRHRRHAVNSDNNINKNTESNITNIGTQNEVENLQQSLEN